MTAFALDYRADRIAVASDSLAYAGAEPHGFVGKVYQLPHLRAVFFAAGRLALTVPAYARLLTHPGLFTVEDAAEALPGILQDVTAHFADENGLGDPTTLRILECTFCGWSEAEGRMRLWQFLSRENYRPHPEFDGRYGGPYCIPSIPQNYVPLDRSTDTLEQKLIGVLQGADKFCLDHADIADGTRLGGDIALTVVSEGGISHRKIGAIQNVH